MEPIPETLQAFDELDAALDDTMLLDQLRTTAARAREVAPGLVGVSVASGHTPGTQAGSAAQSLSAQSKARSPSSSSASVQFASGGT